MAATDAVYTSVEHVYPSPLALAYGNMAYAINIERNGPTLVTDDSDTVRGVVVAPTRVRVSTQWRAADTYRPLAPLLTDTAPASCVSYTRNVTLPPVFFADYTDTIPVIAMHKNIRVPRDRSRVLCSFSDDHPVAWTQRSSRAANTFSVRCNGSVIYFANRFVR
jgi:hypothetical protein